ncbi:MAG: DNA primase [Bacteroidota bacterium]
MISKFTIQKINDEARVEDVVGEFVTLKKRGANLLGLCPFHNEKTPSFNVNPARNIYKCFGCGKAGGPLQFLIDYQQLTYPDALRYLAKKYNIEIEEENVTDEDKQKELEKHNTVESIYIANAAAQKFFTEYMLNNEHGKIGLAYFKERGFLNHTIEKFQLGFSPEGYDVFTKHALKEGFQLEVLKKAGLTSPKENSTIDFFRNRVMFPIHNMTGKVVGFGGRIMIKDEKAPKYVNTPESEVYLKSKILYGAYFAKNEIRKKDECLMVEGYTDVISLHQSGIENAVASSGTSLTVDQIRLIKRITPNITMLYDGDAAGIKAALRGTDLILEEGMNVRIVILPDSEDPDSYVRKVGSENFYQFIQDNKKDLISFKTALFAEEAKKDPIKKAQLIRDVIDSIAKIPDTIQRSVYVKESSQQFDMSEQILITEVNKQRRKKVKEQEESEQKEEQRKQVDKSDDQFSKAFHKEQFNGVSSSLEVVEKDIIRILIEFGNWKLDTETEIDTVTAYVLDDLEGIDIETPKFKPLYELVQREFLQGNVHDEKFFTTNDDEKITSLAIEILTQPHSLSENWWQKYKIVVPDKKSMFIKDIQSACVRLKQFKNIAELRKVEKLLKDAKDDGELMRLMKLHKLLIEQKKEFALTVGNVIYRPTT